MNITVFLGAPGSGKGTQAKQLAEKHAFNHFSTGDMLRAAIKSGSPVGLKAKQFTDKGELVPDGVMIELIEKALAGLPANAESHSGWLSSNRSTSRSARWEADDNRQPSHLL